MTYDAIIAGASFAGLAVAVQLRGKQVLLLDRKPIGSGQTSACAVPVAMLQALGLEKAILQTHDRLVSHMLDHTYVWPLSRPFCTFDYSLCCQLLREQTDAEFVVALVHGVDGNKVQTSQGTFEGKLIVDATGWRAVLASSLRPDLVRRTRLSFGLETTVPYQDDGLHGYYDPRGPSPIGVAWIFPAGELSRVGVGSYQGETQLGSRLDRFLDSLDLERDELHGGYLPNALRDPVVGNLFLVGDAAGQCLAVSGEGIRPTFFFGTVLGRLLGRVLEDELSIGEAQKAYRREATARKLPYSVIYLIQRLFPWLPPPVASRLMAFISRPTVLRSWLERFERAFSLDWLQTESAR